MTEKKPIAFLQELNRTNRQMQQRIVELLDGIPNEEVTSKLYLYTLSFSLHIISLYAL